MGLDKIHRSMLPESVFFSGMKNKLINGNFDIWQRGTTQTTISYGSADRWSNDHVGSTKTVTQQSFSLGQTDVPGNPKYFMRTVVVSANSTANSVFVIQNIENVTTFSGKVVTLSFWAKADSAKSIQVNLQQHFGTGGSPSAALTGIGSTKLDLTTVWTKYSVKFDVPSVAGKTIGTNSNDCLKLVLWYDAGTSIGALISNQSGTFDLAQVQLEEGPIATGFDDRNISTELSLCQRYFELLRDNLTAGNNTAGRHFVTWMFQVMKRSPPTISNAGAGVTTINAPNIQGVSAFITSGAYAILANGTYADSEL